MKTTTTLLLTALTALTGPALVAENLTPTGTLDIAKRLVRTGTKPVLNWNIEYPNDIEEIITIDPKNTVTPLQDVLVEMRVVGTSYQPYGSDTNVQFKARIGESSSWQQLFLGKTADLNPNVPVYSQVVQAGTKIDISGKGHKYSNNWTPTRQTGAYSLNVKALTNGDPVPYYSPAFQQGDIESHVSSYVQDGKVVLNPRDVIYLVELGQNSPTSGGFDMQDLVVVVSFKDVPAGNNNNFGFGN